jgi:hypothetical protein
MAARTMASGTPTRVPPNQLGTALPLRYHG